MVLVPTVLFGSKLPRSKLLLVGTPYPHSKLPGARVAPRRGRAELTTPPCDVVAAPIESVPSSPPRWPVTPAAFAIRGAARLVDANGAEWPLMYGGIMLRTHFAPRPIAKETMGSSHL